MPFGELMVAASYGNHPHGVLFRRFAESVTVVGRTAVNNKIEQS